MISWLFYVIVTVLVLAALYFLYEKSGFQLKCIISEVNGNKYCVRERNRVEEAADLLARITEKCKDFVSFLESKYPNDVRTQRLSDRFDPDQIGETLPTSQYTAYSENKGEAIKFCLNESKNNNNHLIDEHTLMFVALHEMTHVLTKSIGHKTEFWDNFKWVLERAKEANIHQPVDYSKQKRDYCGIQIQSNPFFNTSD